MINAKFRINLVLIVLLIINLLSNCVYATENIIDEQAKELGIEKYINQANKYIDNTLEIDIEDAFNDLVKGNTDDVKKTILDKVINLIGGEIKPILSLLTKILVIALISSILTSLTDAFGKTSKVSQIRFLYCIYCNCYISNDNF